MLRAANCQRSPRSHQPLAPVASEPVLRGRSTTSATSTTPTNGPPLNNPTPLTSTGSTASSTASSGYSSIQSGGYNHDTNEAMLDNGLNSDYHPSSASSASNSTTKSLKVSVPSVSSGSSSTDSSAISSNGSNYRIIPIIKVGLLNISQIQFVRSIQLLFWLNFKKVLGDKKFFYLSAFTEKNYSCLRVSIWGY